MRTTAQSNQVTATTRLQERLAGAVELVSNFSVPVADSKIAQGAFTVGHSEASWASHPSTGCASTLDLENPRAMGNREEILRKQEQDMAHMMAQSPGGSNQL